MNRTLIASMITLAVSGLLAFADETEQQRMQRLEDAVRQLQKQNELLQKRVEELEQQKAVPQARDEAAKNSPSPFVLPWGKESKLVLGGFLQANGEFGDPAAFEGSFPKGKTATDNHVDERFRLRRARLNVSGDFFENFDFKFEGDFGLGDGLSSKRTGFSGTDIFANWHQFPEANIKVGQYKAPFGLEQLAPDTTMFTAERTLVTGALTPERQIGVQLWGKPLTHLAPDWKDRLSYAVGVFNGNGRNVSINDSDDFMFAGRLEFMPFKGKLWGQEAKWKIGADTFFSRDAKDTNLSQTGNLKLNADGSLTAFSSHQPDERWAWGVDQSFTLGPFDLSGEYIQENVQPRAGSGTAFTEFHPSGYWIQGSYYLPFLDKKFQVVSKWESFNPDQAAHDDIRSITGGLNYYIKGDHIKLMLDYIHTWSDFRRANPSLGRDEFDEAVLRLQLMF